VGGVWVAPVSIGALGAVYYFWPFARSSDLMPSRAPREGRPPVASAHQREFVLTIALLATLAATLVVVCMLALGTGQINVELPRRYGFVPYTLLAMLIGSLLSEPFLIWIFGGWSRQAHLYIHRHHMVDA